jgi:hypothetical protein
LTVHNMTIVNTVKQLLHLFIAKDLQKELTCSESFMGMASETSLSSSLSVATVVATEATTTASTMNDIHQQPSTVDEIQENVNKFLLQIFNILLEVRNSTDVSTLATSDIKAAELFVQYKSLFDSFDRLQGIDQTEHEQNEVISALATELFETQKRIKALEVRTHAMQSDIETRIQQVSSLRVPH